MKKNEDVTDEQSTIAEFEADLANAQEGSDSARPAVLLPFVGYLLYFVGIAQISGGLVHFPLDPSYYAALATVGVITFLIGTILNEVILRSPRPSVRSVVRVISTGIVLAIGLGMVSGGVQHFTDFPERAVLLIPVGLVLAYIGFVTHSPRGGLRRMIVVGISVASVAAALFVVLYPFAEALAGGDHHG